MFSKPPVLVSIALLVAAALFFAGVKVGAWTEMQRIEYLQSYAPVAAEDLLRGGDVAKALEQSYIAKAYERREGMMDGQLGRAYMANRMPCLAQSFLESSLNFMERESLKDLPTYASTKTLLAKAARECTTVRAR